MNISQAAVDQWLNWLPRYWPYHFVHRPFPGACNTNLVTPVCTHRDMGRASPTMKTTCVLYGMHCRGGFDAGRTIKLHLACLLFFSFLPIYIHVYGHIPIVSSPWCSDDLKMTFQFPSHLAFTPHYATTTASLKHLQNTTTRTKIVRHHILLSRFSKLLQNTTLESGVQFSDRSLL